MSRLAVAAGALALFFATSARAQFGGLLDKARSKAEDAAIKAAEDAASGKKEQPRPPQPAPQQAQQQPAAQEAQRPAAPAASEGAATAPAKAPEVYGNRFDFVPGDKVLAYDDFGDTDVGEYPAKWTVKDGGGGNAVEVVEVGGRRLLKSRPQPGGQEASLHWLRFDPKGDMPRSFTIELDADVGAGFSIVFTDLNGFGGSEVRFGWEKRDAWTEHATGKLPAGAQGVQHVSIAISGTQAKVYVGGERVLADPEAIVRPVKRLGFQFFAADEERADHQMFTAYRLAEGGKDAKTMLAGEGRIVTHGILFDTGSDVIKPESGPTLRSILALLTSDPALRFSVEGHTDDQGGAKVNGPLSERRAQAVRAWLVRQGVAEPRLTARGLGDTRPIDTNATAEGRANNRRVEFVKIADRA